MLSELTGPARVLLAHQSGTRGSPYFMGRPRAPHLQSRDDQNVSRTKLLRKLAGLPRVTA